MRVTDLVKGTRYALQTDVTSHREGIPYCTEVTYVDRKFPGMRSSEKQVVILERMYRGTGHLRAVGSKRLLCTWDDYLDRCEKYDDENEKRAAANNKAVEYLEEQLSMLYSAPEVHFESSTGYFRVSPQVMATLHNLPQPTGGWTPQQARRTK